LPFTAYGHSLSFTLSGLVGKRRSFDVCMNRLKKKIRKALKQENVLFIIAGVLFSFVSICTYAVKLLALVLYVKYNAQICFV